MDEVRFYLVEMVENGLKFDVFIYGVFISGYIEVGEFVFVEKYLKEMVECGVVLNKVLCIGLISEYCKKGKIIEACLVFRFMVE